MQPALGRGFRDGDDRPGAEPVIILGDDLWHDKYAAAPDIIGATVRANGVQRTVIGVMPERFAFPIREALWIPLTLDPLAKPRGQGPSYRVIARLKPGVRVAQARAQAATIAGQLESEFPATNRGIGADVLPYARTVLGPEIYALLYTMLGAGIGVLLIACVNVSNLLVARASLRRREVAVRMALGAGRTRVVRQHLTEVLVLAAAGGGIGILLSVFGMRWFTRALSVDPPPFWITFELDYRVLLFVIGLIVLASLFAGAVPALHAARVTAGSALKDDSRSSTSASLGRFSSALVVVELAVSCGLLIAAGLMVKSVTQLKNVQMPFAIERVLTARVDLPRAGYPDSAASIRYFDQLLPRLQALPGVEAATLSDGLPAAGNGSITVQIEGKAYPQASDYPVAREGIVTAGYFETFQTKLLGGREFTPADTAAGQPVAIVNQSFAKTHFPNIDPLGHLIQAHPAELAGAVAHDRRGRPRSHHGGHRQQQRQPGGLLHPDRAERRRQRRAHGDPDQRRAGGDDVVRALGGGVARSGSRDLRHQHDAPRDRSPDHRSTRIFGTFFMVFGACALFLAAAGLYGVMAFAVTQRTREMGVRSALGAQGGSLILLVMRKSVLQLAVGLTLGLVLALLASGALEPVLYRVNPTGRGGVRRRGRDAGVRQPDRELSAGPPGCEDRPGRCAGERVAAIGSLPRRSRVSVLGTIEPASVARPEHRDRRIPAPTRRASSSKASPRTRCAAVVGWTVSQKTNEPGSGHITPPTTMFPVRHGVVALVNP